jgi:hypothetical protein
MTGTIAYPTISGSDLTDAQLAELKTELVQELHRLSPDPTSGARTIDVRTQTRIQLIRDALKRIRAGIYGGCLVCRLPIPYDRLAVIPEATTCVRCL